MHTSFVCMFMLGNPLGDSQTRKYSLLLPYGAFYNCEEWNNIRSTGVSLPGEVLGDRRLRALQETMECERTV